MVEEIAMDPANPFKWRHFEGEIILLCVRWYLRYSLSYRDLEEMMAEREERLIDDFERPPASREHGPYPS